MKESNISKSLMKQWLLRVILLFFTFIVLMPLLWSVISSFKSTNEFYNDPWGLPKTFRFINYVNAIKNAKMGDFFMNSIMVTILSLIFLMLLAVPAAYVLSRYKFKGNKFIQILYMMGLFIQPTFIIVPLFTVMKALNLLDNRLALSLIYAVLQLPFSIYILIGFMKTLPKEYEEAAIIDGCGYFQTLVKVIVPLSKPGIVTVLIFNFMAFWNEYAMAFTFITSPQKKTLSVGLQNLMEVQKFATDWGALFAGLVIVMLPTIIIYSMLHKKLTDGVSMGGIKG